jgi:hypothetical protein
MSETGKAIETLRRCLRTGDLTGGEAALEQVTLRLLNLVSEVAQLKRDAEGKRLDEWRREFEAGIIDPSEVAELSLASVHADHFVTERPERSADDPAER